jgi:exopolyphosphatase/guanosine-5'-triphosphate,3'-diphosphate pyrophosphatase
MTGERLAAVDLGTNTARLLIGQVGPHGVRRDLVERRITRLGGGFSRAHGIAGAARERTLAALAEFSAIMADMGVSRLRAVATSAVRDAVNGRDFCDQVTAATRIRLEVIDGIQEGALTLDGVRSGLVTDTNPCLLVIDIGGGSTELILCAADRILFSYSLPLGVVRLTEGKRTPEAMQDKIFRELQEPLRRMTESGVIDLVQGASLLGTAGTATTLAAIDIGLSSYDYRLVNGHRISRAAIGTVLQRLLDLSPAERLVSVAGLEKGREDLIVAGTLIVTICMDLFGFDHFSVSDYGLLEGVLLSIVKGAPGAYDVSWTRPQRPETS